MGSSEIELEEILFPPVFTDQNQKEKDKFLSDLQQIKWEDKPDDFTIKIHKDKIIYTPMQFAARCGFKNMVQSLLRANADPNFCASEHNDVEASFSKKKKNRSIRLKPIETSNDEYEKCKIRPLFLAAHHGHHEILKLFKYHGDHFRDTASMSSIAIMNEKCNRENEKLLESKSKSKVLVDFNVINDKEKRQSVLHVVLKQPLLELERKKERLKNIHEEWKESIQISADQNGDNEHKKLMLKRRKLQQLANDYGKCLNVLLDMDEFKDKNTRNKHFPTQIREIINHRNYKKNTPLHYARNWPCQVAEKLMGLGANPSLRNQSGEIPLLFISKSTFENFLDKRCIHIDGFDPSDNEMEEDEGKDDSAKNISQDYDQKFMWKINTCGSNKGDDMTFDFGFLRPRKHKISKDEDGVMVESPGPSGRTFNLNTIGYGNKDVEKSIERESAKESEMDVLWDISQSKEHRSLIEHPVIEAFVWAKWKLMTKFNNRMLRLRFLFMYCILWHIFAIFGGYNWMSITFHNGEMKNATGDPEFCNDNLSFPTLTEIWKQEYFMLSSLWYYFFIVVTLIQMFLITRDYGSDTCDQVASWIDVAIILLSLSILVFGDSVLWLVITSLLLFYAISEIIELIAVRSKYFCESSNYFDMTMLFLTFIILYLPQEKIGNPKFFSVFESGHGCGCKVKRSMSALIIVLVWSRFLMSLAMITRLKKYNLYLIMFSKVIKTYWKIMLLFICYIIAFGLGFYIALHGDTEATAKSKTDDTKKVFICNETSSGMSCAFPEEQDTSKFDIPFVALIKTGTMFMGEFDFDDLPMHGGNLSVSISYIFLISFIFVIAIVMVNLLNALAISDTQQILSDSKIESQISIIEAIRYFESVYLDSSSIPWFFGKFENEHCVSIRKYFFNKMIPMKLSLFGSKDVPKHTLTLPLMRKNKDKMDEEKPPQQRNNNQLSLKELLLKFKNWFLRSDQDYGSEPFLHKARKILIRLKKAKEAERKQNQLQDEIYRIEGQRKKKFELLRNNTYRDQIQSMETKLDIVLAKFASADY